MKDFKKQAKEAKQLEISQKFRGKNKLNLNKFHQQVNKNKPNKPETKNLKKKIRDLERFINKEGLDNHIKHEKEIELEKLKKEHDQNQRKNKRLDRKITIFHQKYDRIKQVELTKLRRKLKQVHKQIEEQEQGEQEGSATSLEELNKDKQDILDKISYVKHFPEDQKYLSLFAKNQDDLMVKKRHKIMEEILEKAKKIKSLNTKIDVEQEVKREKIMPKIKVVGKKNKEKDTFFITEEEEGEKDNSGVEEEGEQEQKIVRKIVDKQGNIINA